MDATVDTLDSRSAVVVVSVLPDGVISAAVEAALHATTDLRVTLTTARDLAAARSLLSRARFDALLVDPHLFQASGPERLLLGELVKKIPVVMVGPAGAVRSAEAVRMGVRDYVPIDDRLSVTLPAALRNALVARTGKPATTASRQLHGRTIGFVGTAGGVGTTTALLNCAVALGLHGRSVIVAELSAWSSSFGAQLNQSPTGTLADLLSSPEHIGRGIEAYLQPLTPNVRVLFGSPVPRPLTPADAEPLDRVLRELSRLADVVLVDLPVRLPEPFRDVARHLDQVVLVAPPDSGPGPASEALDRLRTWGIGKARVALLAVDRYARPTSSGSAEAGCRAFGISYLGRVPPAARAMRSAAERGLPLLLAARDHPAALFMEVVARELHAAADHQRLKVVLVNADDAAAGAVCDLLDESDPVRFDVARAVSLDDALGEISRGAFHAVLLLAGDEQGELERDVTRVADTGDQTALVVLSVGSTPAVLGRALARGAQESIELGRTDSYWLVHCILSAIERQRMTQRLRAQKRELESCEVSHRRIIVQLLREAQHDPRMV